MGPKEQRAAGRVGQTYASVERFLARSYRQRDGERGAVFALANDVFGHIEPTVFDHIVIGSHPSRILLLRSHWEPAIPMIEQSRKLCIEAGLRFSVPWFYGLPWPCARNGRGYRGWHCAD